MRQVGWLLISDSTGDTSMKLKERADDRVSAEELLNSFKDACVWGGVRLPEPDSSALAVEVLNVWKLLSQGQEPPSGYRLNSAWTKLYALALPDRCVIYDSRVVTAVTSILDPTMQFVSQGAKWQSYKNLGTVPGRGGLSPLSVLALAERVPRVGEPDGCKSLVSRSARRAQPAGGATTRLPKTERSSVPGRFEKWKPCCSWKAIDDVRVTMESKPRRKYRLWELKDQGTVDGCLGYSTWPSCAGGVAPGGCRSSWPG